MIAASSIEGCSLANNHSYDYLQAGYDETIDALNDAGVLYTADSKPIVTSVGDIEAVIISGNYVNDGVQIGQRGDKLTKQICQYIEQYKKEDNIVITVCHWGEEQKDAPNKIQKDAAHSFIDAGADLVVGHHPHVLQGAEIYKGKYVFYSLGNFAFAGNSGVTDMSVRSMILRPRIAMKDGKAEVTGVGVVPCYTTSTGTRQNNFRPIPLFGDEAGEMRDYIIKISEKINGGVTELNVLSSNIE